LYSEVYKRVKQIWATNTINIDEFIENHAGILENLNIPLKRKNIDKTKIKYGNLLLNFCKANQFFYCK
jgi:hypothetical protein